MWLHVETITALIARMCSVASSTTASHGPLHNGTFWREVGANIWLQPSKLGPDMLFSGVRGLDNALPARRVARRRFLGCHGCCNPVWMLSLPLQRLPDAF